MIKIMLEILQNLKNKSSELNLEKYYSMKNDEIDFVINRINKFSI